MRVLIFGLNYAPEQIGIGPYTQGFAEYLAVQGHDVEVVAGNPYYPEWKVRSGHKRRSRSLEKGVNVWRCPHYVPGSPTSLRRILHYLSFAWNALPVLWRRSGALQPDVVIAIAPALLAAPVALLAAKRSGATSWLHVQDFEIEAALATGLMSSGFLARMATLFEDVMLRSFDRVSSISSAMVAKAANRGVKRDRLCEIRNWAELDKVNPAVDGSALRRELGLPDGRIALYSGNLAMKQGIGLIADAAERLSGRSDIHFLVCGDGAGRTEFADRVARLPNVTLAPLQPRERLGELLAIADVHLLPQLAGAADAVLPSKLTNMLASGRPIVATAAPGTALYEEVSGCGLTSTPGDVDSFSEAIGRLIDDEAVRQGLGVQARQRAIARWSRQSILSGFAAKLEELGEQADAVYPVGSLVQ